MEPQHEEVLTRLVRIETKTDGINVRLDITNGQVAKNRDNINKNSENIEDLVSFQKGMISWRDWALKILLGAVLMAILGLIFIK